MSQLEQILNIQGTDEILLKVINSMNANYLSGKGRDDNDSPEVQRIALAYFQQLLNATYFDSVVSAWRTPPFASNTGLVIDRALRPLTDKFYKGYNFLYDSLNPEDQRKVSSALIEKLDTATFTEPRHCEWVYAALTHGRENSFLSLDNFGDRSEDRINGMRTDLDLVNGQLKQEVLEYARKHLLK